MDEFTDYKRFPIQISRTTYAVMHMFEYEPDHIEDIMLPDEILQKMSDVDYDLAADQFIKQFEGSVCVYFLRKLRDRINTELKVSDEKEKVMKDKLKNSDVAQ